MSHKSQIQSQIKNLKKGDCFYFDRTYYRFEYFTASSVVASQGDEEFRFSASRLIAFWGGILDSSKPFQGFVNYRKLRGLDS